MSMDVLEGKAEGVKDYGLERLIMLSDGVFAIAITLLALEVRPPEGWDRTLSGLVGEMWREMLAYVMAFLTIAIYWASHRRTFGRFTRSDGGVTAFNFLVLGLITLLPFGSRLIAEGGPRGEPFSIFLGLIAAIGVANALLWGYAAFIARVVDPKMPPSLRLVILLIQLIVPTLMAGAGMMVASPHSWGYMAVSFAVAGAIIALRRRLGKSAGE